MAKLRPRFLISGFPVRGVWLVGAKPKDNDCLENSNLDLILDCHPPQKMVGHIVCVAICGFNIAIVADLLMLAGTKALSKRPAVPLALAGIVLYTLLVGANAAVVRAAIIGCLYMLALYFGCQTEVRTSLIFSALLMTAINPIS
jgi:hypothetical protein